MRLLSSSLLALASFVACGGSANTDLQGAAPGIGTDVAATTPDASASDPGPPGGGSAVGTAPVDGGSDGGSDGGACPSWKKTCGGACVDTLDPAAGCGGASCEPCAARANANATCEWSGACSFACNAGFVDCNGNAADGCETSTMNDPLNCGACGHGCKGAACAFGLCTPTLLASNQLDPADVAVDGTSVYWASTVGGTVAKVAKTGGATTVLATGQNTPMGVLLDEGWVYFSNTSNIGAVLRVPKAGGAAQTVASGQYYPYRMAIDGDTLYVTSDSTAGNVSTVPKAGGAVSIFAASQSSPKGIVVDATGVYWTSFKEVKRSPKSGNGITKLSTQEKFPYALAADATSLYWSDGYAYAIRKSTKTGAGTTTLATLPFGQGARSIAIDDTAVYWVSKEGDLVQKVSKSGGTPMTLAKASAPLGVAVDEAYVYWTNSGDGSVMRVAK